MNQLSLHQLGQRVRAFLSPFLNQAILIALVSLSGFALLKVYLRPGFPYTHDGENHLARFANYKLALKEGQWPPRLAPNLLNHFTYPVFNFNYPLANLLSLPLSFFKLNYELSFKLIAGGAVVALLLGTNLWLKRLGLSFSARTIGLLSVLAAPYVINTIWFRGNIGELIALTGFALGLWLTEAWSQTQASRFAWGLGVCAVGILLAHNIAALMLVPLLLSYGCLVMPRRQWSHLGLVWGLAVLLTLWFWLPALAEKHTIVLDDAQFFQEASRYLVPGSQLISRPSEFGFVYPGSISSLNTSLGILTWGGLGISVVWLFLTVKTWLTQRPTLSQLRFWWVGLSIFALVGGQTTASSWLWQHLPGLSYLQFPWRLALPLTILMALVLASWWHWATRYQARWLQVSLICLVGLQSWSLVNLKAADYFHKTNLDYQAYGQTTSTLNENLPKGFRFLDFGDWQPTPTILTGTGSLQVIQWSGTLRRYQLHLTQPSLIVEPSIVWLGFETRANGQRMTYLDSDQIQGRLAYQLPAGDYQVVTQFTQHTWARQIGNTLSWVTGVGVLGGALLKLSKLKLLKRGRQRSSYDST